MDWMDAVSCCCPCDAFIMAHRQFRFFSSFKRTFVDERSSMFSSTDAD